MQNKKRITQTLSSVVRQTWLILIFPGYVCFISIKDEWAPFQITSHYDDIADYEENSWNWGDKDVQKIDGYWEHESKTLIIKRINDTAGKLEGMTKR